jgi:uncharacterized protein (DUF1697 family)
VIYVALLRGINVGGKNKIPMPKLRSLFEDLGHGEVTTLLQSGNVVFQGPSRASGKIIAGIEHGISETFGLEVTVLLRTHLEMKHVIAGNPFRTRDAEFKSLHVMFLATAPAPAVVGKLDPDRSPPDEFQVGGREVYLRYPNGSGRSKLTIDYFERALGTSATARNWNTVTKVLTLMETLS